MIKFFSNLIYFYKRKVAPGFKVPKHWLVLDVGSGNMPFWRADVFLDDLKYQNIHRHLGGKTINNMGVFVNSDATKMPFKDKAFDFSFCSHLLEHVENPGAVINEIVRVSKQGYIEVPNGILETIAPFHSHLWFIYHADRTLYFVNKSQRIHSILIKNGVNFRQLFKVIPDPFIRLYWNKKINYKILDKEVDGKRFTPKNNSRLHAENPRFTSIYVLITKVLRTLFYNPKSITKDMIFKV